MPDTKNKLPIDKRPERRKVLLDLFSPIAPYSNGFISVDDTHDVYWEQSGNPDGIPIVFLHGGPGAGASDIHRRFFDPDHYRIVIFDQRGCGRSQPHGSLKNNTAQHLVQDIETLRAHLSIKRWHIFGGSWGSTLAMHYASQYPQNCISLIMRGIFLCEREEIEWFLHGMGHFFPVAWEQFAGLLPPKQRTREHLLKAYYQRLTDPDKNVQTQAAIRWSLYEGACSSLYPNYETITTNEQKESARALARIEAHYFMHECIKPEDSLLNKIESMRAIPTTIIQGRYDVICPIKTAFKLHQAWPEADYIVVPDAGHSALDPPLRSRLIEATQNYKTLS